MQISGRRLSNQMTKKVLTLATFAVLSLSTGIAFASQFNTPVPTLSQAQVDVPIPIPPQLPGLGV